MKRSTCGLATLLKMMLAATACDVLDPSPARVGTFVLRSVDGEPVPTVLAANDVVSTTVLDDRIILYDDGTAEKIIEVRYTVPGATSPGEVDRSRSTLDYHETAGGIELNYRCADNASCIGPPHLVGRMTETGLQLDQALNYRVPLVYERID